MKINKLPIDIQRIAKIRIAEQGRTFDSNSNLSGSFLWDKTKEFAESKYFWDDVNRGNYTLFYKLYPKEIEVNEKRMKLREEYSQQYNEDINLNIERYADWLEKRLSELQIQL